MTEAFTIPSNPPAQPPVDYTQPPADQATTSSEPQLIAGKFKTQEDLIAAYKALETKLGAPKQEVPAQEPTTTPSQETDPALAVPPKFDPENPTYVPGLTPQQVMENARLEFTAKQELSDAAYAALASQGISKEMVHAYIEGQKASQVTQFEEAVAVVGGKDKYQQLTAWASVNLSDAEVDEYNAAIANPATRKLAMQGLLGKYTMVNGAAPGTLIAGNTAPAVNSFASKAEMVTAMKDPRYSKDPAYRDMVSKKLANSFL